jgi:HK97 family phage major capsid protein
MTAPALPKTTAEWDHYLSGLDTAEKFAAANKDGSFKAALESRMNAKTSEAVDIQAQVSEQVSTQMTEWFKENGQKVTNKVNLATIKDASATPSRVYNNPRATGAPLNGLFPDVYSFMQAAWHNANNDAETRSKLEKIKNYQEKVPSEGGLLVPEEFRSQIMQLAVETSIVRPNATVIPMRNPRLSLPIVDETSRVSSIFGGVIVYRTEEGAELEESMAKFAALKLDVTKQTALAHVTNELVRDWGAFGAWFDASVPTAMGFYEDIDFLSGNGAGEPLGMLNAANGAIIEVAKETGQGASTIVWENVLRMYGRLLPSSYATAMWIAAPNTFFELATMALTVGTGGSAVWITDAHGRPQLTLLGLPVKLTEKAPAGLGTRGDLSLVDPKMYAIGDYQTMTIDSSPHVKFTSDKTTFRAIARNDGRPMLLSPITPHYGGDTLSPFVQLATRS